MRLSELLARVKGRHAGGIEWVRGTDQGAGGGDPEITRICEDSRLVRAGDLFVARGGTKTDGSRFAADAVNRGAAAVLAGSMSVFRGSSGDTARGEMVGGVAVVVAENVGLVGALMAHEAAGNPTAGMKMIGITGTKGKTTVAYLMRSVLKAAGRKVGMIGTVEIDDGKMVVPADMTTPGVGELVELFCRMRDNGVTHCVMEVSSHALHQHRVAGIDFAVGIFTNLTGDHLDYHKTMEEYAAAKAMLFEGLKEGAVAVINADDAWVSRMVQNCRARIIPYCLGKDLPQNGWAGTIERMNAQRMDVLLQSAAVYKLQPFPNIKVTRQPFINLRSPLIGKHNAYNLLCTCAAADALGVDLHVIAGTLLNCKGAPGRLQRADLKANFSVFVDYAHTHDALANVLQTLRAVMDDDNEADAASIPRLHELLNDPELPPTEKEKVRMALARKPVLGRLICVFGCGGDRDRTKRPKMGAVAEKLADVVIVTSDNPRTEVPGAIIEEICAGFSIGWKERGKITIEPDRRAAIKLAIGMAQAGDVVLIAGKGHENYQIIGTTKHHFDDVEEAEFALEARMTTHT